MFTDGKKFGLQSCEADYVHLNAGIRLKSSFTPSVNIVPRSGQITGSWDQGRQGLDSVQSSDTSAEILFQSFPQEALVSSSGMGKDVHSLMLSVQHFLC